MDTLKLGQIIEPGREVTRDATHIAVAPVIADKRLAPGARVGFVDGRRVSDSVAQTIGIIDPFLSSSAKAGDEVWLYLYPGSITGLRHEWTHPAFMDAPTAPLPDLAYSEAWLRRYASRLNSYEKDPDAAYQSLCDGLRERAVFAHGSDLHGLYDLDDAEELREHAQKVLGIRIEWDHYEFSCSC